MAQSATQDWYQSDIWWCSGGLVVGAINRDTITFFYVSIFHLFYLKGKM